eukprot:COSAG03_NODE_124_length_12185_cov_3.572977_6_plen_144_part_00
MSTTPASEPPISGCEAQLAQVPTIVRDPGWFDRGAHGSHGGSTTHGANAGDAAGDAAARACAPPRFPGRTPLQPPLPHTRMGTLRASRRRSAAMQGQGTHRCGVQRCVVCVCVSILDRCISGAECDESRRRLRIFGERIVHIV